MRTPIEFTEYRAWYYFFQYQFFTRSCQGSHRIAPKSRLAQFLFGLTYDAHTEHYRWETPPSIQMGPPRRKERGSDPLPSSLGKVVLFRAKRKSIRQHYMLFSFPEGHRADHITLLYKALVAYDMNAEGLTDYTIAKRLITEAETFPTISKVRQALQWYDRLFDDNLGRFEWSEINAEAAIERFPSKVMATERSKQDGKLKGEREELYDPIRSRSRDINRYKKVADVLIKLTWSGRLAAFPSEIARIK